MITAFVSGVGVGGSLITGIGAQTAFVLDQSIRREHHRAVIGVCVLCDVLLIGVGVLGVGATIASSALLARIASWGGAAFLVAYGLSALRSAVRGAPASTETLSRSRRDVIQRALALTLLNPHVYLDTVVLLGGVSAQHAGAGRYAFGLGAMVASCVWFSALGAGGRSLAPILSRPIARRVLDGGTAIAMFAIAAALLV